MGEKQGKSSKCLSTTEIRRNKNYKKTFDKFQKRGFTVVCDKVYYILLIYI